MLRLPATSVSLSEHDIQLHLDRINAYHSLLAQGFKKKDIIRYYAEHNQQTNPPPSPLTGSIPSCLDMVTAARLRRTLSSDDSSVSISASPIEPSSPLTSQPALPHRPARHAPRHCSLLRFAEAVSPEKDPDEVPLLLSSDPFTSSLRQDRCGPISSGSFSDDYMNEKAQGLEEELSRLTLQSSPPNISTSHDTGGHYGTGMLFSPGIRSKSPVSSPLRPEAAEFRPQSMPLQHTVSRELPGDRINYSAHSVEACPQHNDFNDYSPAVSVPGSTPPRTSSLTSQSSSASVRRRSPESIKPRQPSSALAALSSSLPATVPATPTPSRRVDPPRTEPAGRRNLGSDGTSFAVYDDHLPAANQPQTPADLSRRPLITEHEAAYTAPPGRVLATSTRSPRLPRMWTRLDPGEQSPTVRAMGIRERRLREAMRSARLEAALLNGNGDDELFRQWNGEGQAWRYSLDVDRVGEENFENDETFVRLANGRDVMEDRGG